MQKIKMYINIQITTQWLYISCLELTVHQAHWAKSIYITMYLN